ncbi:efflux RND transporter periplasmic adaptor subunit [Vibrio gallicus]|uniref:efflux RND transporter periplasmic adaptor subunit n=1 Tax=Vibrio gallicus TaxID=190897 RepID=UPI0021C2B1A1|nr:efflux RND transporter periplasmic adaptor subunit [Vibrio gallicus]
MTLGVCACNDATTTPDIPKPLLTVATHTLTLSKSYDVTREYVGTVKAGQQAKLGFELGGKISNLMADVGQNVAAGAPLITLDTQLLETEAAQLKAQKNEIRAHLKLVAANLKRQNSLKAKGFSAEAEIDALTSQQGVLQANALRLDASLKANQLRIEKSTIKAPYSGTISQRLVSLGDVVAMGTPTLVLLEKDNKEAFIGIPSAQLSVIQQLKKPQVLIGHNTYPVTLLNPGAQVDLTTRSVGLRYLLPNTAKVLDGQLAYLTYPQSIPESGFWIPNSALTDGLRGVWNVFVINNQEQVERRSVQVLYADEQHAFVQGAINSGEQIIAKGLHRVVPGQQVALLQAAEQAQ